MELKKCISKWLFSIARRLDPQREFEKVDNYKAKKLQVGYRIKKSDVRKYHESHPEIKSQKECLRLMIEDTKSIIFGNIVAGIVDNNLVEYEVKKMLMNATVKGVLNVYVLTDIKDSDNGSTKEKEDHQ